jgi:hypothetical protein
MGEPVDRLWLTYMKTWATADKEGATEQDCILAGLRAVAADAWEAGYTHAVWSGPESSDGNPYR